MDAGMQQNQRITKIKSFKQAVEVGILLKVNIYC